MVHYSLVKMTSQMVFALLVKNTTLVTLDMLKIDLSKMIGGLFGPCPNLVFLTSLKNQEF
jgi:hypothetical protein